MKPSQTTTLTGFHLYVHTELTSNLNPDALREFVYSGNQSPSTDIGYVKPKPVLRELHIHMNGHTGMWGRCRRCRSAMLGRRDLYGNLQIHFLM